MCVGSFLALLLKKFGHQMCNFPSEIKQKWEHWRKRCKLFRCSITWLAKISVNISFLKGRKQASALMKFLIFIEGLSISMYTTLSPAILGMNLYFPPPQPTSSMYFSINIPKFFSRLCFITALTPNILSTANFQTTLCSFQPFIRLRSQLPLKITSI